MLFQVHHSQLLKDLVVHPCQHHRDRLRRHQNLRLDYYKVLNYLHYYLEEDLREECYLSLHFYQNGLTATARASITSNCRITWTTTLTPVSTTSGCYRRKD